MSESRPDLNAYAYELLANGEPVIEITLPGYEEPVSATILETEALWLAARLTHLVYERQRHVELSAEDSQL
ncbi:hypothetical protein EAH68_05315 [Corynebacterium hylobatis]|uniref:Uncharacterized protein n=1 Tax=Corynebacterium hylobatis TaxID=1859290 RepID=A0A430I084_9CORY|nr:hypothetical protein [Corynebacterium hylobatis]RSZ64413.1 hypothetical protein EAH68_05315 [Corynebacterium hylobatis]